MLVTVEEVVVLLGLVSGGLRRGLGLVALPIGFLVVGVVMRDRIAVTECVVGRW